jgi:hypothetical protein
MKICIKYFLPVYKDEEAKHETFSSFPKNGMRHIFNVIFAPVCKENEV